MDFIILDLEWDSAYCKKKSGFINQIIQIGAVKLDQNLNFVDNFSRTVRSAVSKKVTKRFTELTGITTEDMLAGIPLNDAVSEYNEWVGDDFVTLTWSNSDLYAIMNNVKFLLSDGLQFKTGNYADLQSFVQNELRLKGHEINNQISLSAAAEMLGISTDMFELHTALDDSTITAAVLKKTYNESRFAPHIKDTTDPEFYKKLTFKKQYITKLTDPRIEPKHLSFICDKCSNEAKRSKKWKYKNHWFMTEFICLKCGNKFLARVMLKVTYNGVKASKRIIYPTEKVQQDVTV